MSQLMLYKNSLLKPDEGVIKNALLSGDYIICCTLQEPPDIRSLIIETVTCIKQAIPGVINGPAVVEYGVSNDENNTQYRLHDSLTARYYMKILRIKSFPVCSVHSICSYAITET